MPRPGLPPLRFVPFLRPMVWGGRRLGEVLGKTLPSGEPYGESWDVSDHALHRSVIAAGPLAGRSLRDLMENRRDDLLGPAAADHATFPWLIKFLDAHDWLSVQVHPGEKAVQRLWPGESSKTEAWFVLDAQPGSRIYAGLRGDVDEVWLRSALEHGSIGECLHSFEPRAGDCVFLPAGTVHAVGGGVLMAEVQQTSDATFRLFDWKRRDAHGKTRKLHIEEGLASIDWNQGPVTPARAGGFADRFGGGGVIKAGLEQSHPLVRCKYFHLDYLSSGEPFACGGTGRLHALMILAGGGHLAWDRREEVLSPGQVWLLPAMAPVVQCTPERPLAILSCTLP